ncbi:hypothetical protein F2P56_034280 [Juglans regia]|uniref:Uncharacterized protein LOC109020335 n=2 Tax=Juglans regia TaxID=51240 RepID=A0A2I4HQ90_JUGRE|nr:uncharacterized protein LOC109020335 [Juglans regia]KAF5445214.1 hypothetical protein F2P56_034280 [Juglans regia]
MRANKWLIDLDRTFDISVCTKNQKVQYVGHVLQGEAGIWWDTKRQLLALELGDVATLTWEQFKKEFDSSFFLETIKQQKALEFVNLTQGNMMVEQYAARFMELGRFALHLIGTEKMQARKFQDGLQPRIQNQVACLRIENFQVLVNVASIAEAEQQSLVSQVDKDQKRGMPYSPGRNMGKKRVPYTLDKGKRESSRECSTRYSTTMPKMRMKA